MRRWQVGIVGGGPGGLMTAYTIQKWADSLFQLTILEASSRLGGKIQTARFETVPATYEVGAAEIYDYSHMDEDPLKELIEELGLPINRMEGASATIGNRLVTNLDDYRSIHGDRCTQNLIEFDRKAHDLITPQEFYHSDPEGEQGPLVRPGFDQLLAQTGCDSVGRFIEHFIHSDLATEPNKTTLAYGLQNYLMNDPAYMRLYGIVGGNERLPQEIAARLNAEVHLETRVVEIAVLESGRVQVVTDQLGDQQVQEFDFLIVALPNQAARRMKYRGDSLTRVMVEHQKCFDFPAHYLRITIAFREKFWQGKIQDSYCMLDRFGGCCLYDESCRNPGSPIPVLGWLISGSAAEELAAQSDDELLALALDSLPEFLQSGRNLVVEGKVHRWADAVNAIPGGLQPMSLDRRHRPLADHNLFVVGDYLFDSTLNGVLDSAEYTGMWIVSLMAERIGVAG